MVMGAHPADPHPVHGWGPSGKVPSSSSSSATRQGQGSPQSSHKDDSKGKGRPSTPGAPQCYTCRTAGRPYDHRHTECADWKAKQAKNAAALANASAGNSPQTKQRSE